MFASPSLRRAMQRLRRTCAGEPRMITDHNAKIMRILPLAALALSLLPSPSHGGQVPLPALPKTERKITQEASSEPPLPEGSALLIRELGETVALLPWSYKNGKDAALQSAREECNRELLDTGFNVFLVKTTTGAMPPPMPNTGARRTASPFTQILDDGMTRLGKSSTTPAKGQFVLPTVEQMAAIGEKLRTRYVLAGRAQWSSRNVWIGISNRVKSICTVDVLIMDMATRRLTLDARNVMADSTEQKNMYNSVTNAITLNPLPLVLPGSVTPQEQNAVILATFRAMKPWINARRVQAALIQADRSAELSEGAGGEYKFSSLIGPVAVLHASLHVSGEDQKQLAGLDGDLAKILAFHDVGFDYLKPNRLLLTANTPKQEQVTLDIDSETERLAAGPNYKASVKNLAEAPTRRHSLLDFCGLLTREMFEFTRARFVRPEKREGSDAVVYDLTYWGVDDGSYQRVWLDPARRVALKREVYDRDGKLKTVYLYSKLRQVTRGLWVPERLEIRNGSLKPIASIAIDQVTAELGPSEDEVGHQPLSRDKTTEKEVPAPDEKKH